VRYPYERFITFLISRKIDVSEALERVELPPVGDMGIADRKEKIRKTAPPSLVRYLGQSRNDRELVFRDGILDWASENGILSLWQRQKEFGRKIDLGLEEASNIFLNANARTILGTMLLADASPDEITEVIREQFSIDVDRDILASFKNIFWDVGGMGRKSWEDFIPELYDDQRQIVALGMRGMKPNDIRYAIGAEVPSDPKDVLQDILTHAHNQFKQAMSSASPGNFGAFRWADLATKVASVMSSSHLGSFGGDGEEEFPRRGVEGMFSVVVESPKIVSLDDLDGELSKTKSAIDRAIEDTAKKPL